MIHVPYSMQLKIKRDALARALAAYPSLASVGIPHVSPSQHTVGYRSRVKLVVRRTSGEVLTGLYVPGTHSVMDISSCLVHPPRINQLARYIKKKILELAIAPYDERNDTGQLRYLDFRYSFARRELSLTLVTRHREFTEGVPLVRSLTRRFSFLSGVVQNINEGRGNVIWGERYRVLSGLETLIEQIGSLQLGFPAGVFSQANPATAKKIYDLLAEMAALTGRETVLDLYCGAGPISLCLARSARLVLGSDESSRSINAAKQNARRNGIANCRFIAGDIVEAIAQAKKNFAPVDVLVLNPPRKGVQPVALDAIVHLAAPKLLYISCEPTSLARDLDKLIEEGYRMVRLRAFDMFPQTEEVETVALLEKDFKG